MGTTDIITISDDYTPTVIVTPTPNPPTIVGVNNGGVRGAGGAGEGNFNVAVPAGAQNDDTILVWHLNANGNPSFTQSGDFTLVGYMFLLASRMKFGFTKE